MIADNLDNPDKGLRQLIMAPQARIMQLFNSMAEAYYRIHKEGKKEIISDKYSQQYGNGDMVESRESFAGNVERLADKILKNGMLKNKVLLKPEAKEVFQQKWRYSPNGIQKLNDWLFDEDNQEEVKYFYELVFNALKIKDEGDFCKNSVDFLATQVTGAKKDPNLLKAKKILDHMVISLAGDRYNSLSTQSKYRTKNIAAYAFFIKAKLLLCKKL